MQELKKYDEALYQKPRWLVLNKLDLVPEDRAKVYDMRKVAAATAISAKARAHR